jgi:hypothetical protein
MPLDWTQETHVMSNASLRRRCLAIAAATASVAAVSLTMSNVAQASDGKTWPATICQRWTAPSNPSASNLDVSQFGRLVNKSNQRLGVVCPLERDSMTHKIEEVRVFAFSPSCVAASQNQPCAGLTTRCTMRVMDLPADHPRYTSTKTLVRFDGGNPGSAAWMTARWTNITMPNFGAGAPLWNGSSFVMFCEIGPQEHLGGFYLQEGGG